MFAAVSKFFDAYSIRARLFPAIIAVAPALAGLFLLISWEKIALSNVTATVGMLVIVFALSDLARSLGVRKEPRIFALMGGKPTLTMLRVSGGGPFDAFTKDRYRNFMASKIGRPAPDETQAPSAEVDGFYETCGIWLRDQTRDAKKFPLVFGELVTYGFRRNLFGLRWPALGVNVAVLAITATLLWYRDAIDFSDNLIGRIVVVFVVALFHALYFALVVTQSGVEQASRAYAREIFLACETLMKPSARAPAKTPAKR